MRRIEGGDPDGNVTVAHGNESSTAFDRVLWRKKSCGLPDPATQQPPQDRELPQRPIHLNTSQQLIPRSGILGLR